MKHVVDIKLRDKYVCVCQKENCDAIKMPLGNPLWDGKPKDSIQKAKPKLKRCLVADPLQISLSWLQYHGDWARQELKGFSSHACGILNHGFGKYSFFFFFSWALHRNVDTLHDMKCNWVWNKDGSGGGQLSKPWTAWTAAAKSSFPPENMQSVHFCVSQLPVRCLEREMQLLGAARLNKLMTKPPFHVWNEIIGIYNFWRDVRSWSFDKRKKYMVHWTWLVFLDNWRNLQSGWGILDFPGARLSVFHFIPLQVLIWY